MHEKYISSISFQSMVRFVSISVAYTFVQYREIKLINNEKNSKSHSLKDTIILMDVSISVVYVPLQYCNRCKINYSFVTL